MYALVWHCNEIIPFFIFFARIKPSLNKTRLKQGFQCGSDFNKTVFNKTEFNKTGFNKTGFVSAEGV